MKKLLIAFLIMSVTGQMVFAAGGQAASGGKKNVVWYSWSAGGERVLQEKVIEDFHAAHPDINVEANFVVWDEYHGKLNTMFAANSGPDAFMLAEYLGYEWGEKGITADLVPYYQQAGEDVTKIFLPNYQFKAGNRVWGIGFCPTVIVLYYNKDLFRQAGIQPPRKDVINPWTWEEFVDAAKKLTKDAGGRTPNDQGFDYNTVQQFGTMMPTWWNPYLAFLYNAGVGIANPAGTELLISGPTGIKVIQSIANLSQVDRVAPTFAMAESGSFSSAETLLMNNQLAMLIGGAYQYANFENENYDVGVAPIPTFTPGRGTSMTWGCTIAMKKNASPEAFSFFRYMADFNNMVQASKKHKVSVNGGLPWTTNTYSDPRLNADWLSVHKEELAVVAQDILSKAAHLGENVTLKNFAEIMDQGITPALDKVWLGEQTAEYALTNVKASVTSKLQGSW
jgi:multiple sugar transport system substrate-binding protein